MAVQHGTYRRYVEGCRCDDCKAANRSYQANYQQRKAAGEPIGPRGRVVPISAPTVQVSDTPGPVEAGVRAEVEGLAQAQLRPGVAETAFALARILDSPRAVNQQPAASKALVDILDRLRKGADVRKSRLAGVRDMTSAKAASSRIAGT